MYLGKYGISCLYKKGPAQLWMTLEANFHLPSFTQDIANIDKLIKMYYSPEKTQPYFALINTIKYNMKTKHDPLPQ